MLSFITRTEHLKLPFVRLSVSRAVSDLISFLGVFVDGVLGETLDWAYPNIHENCVGEFSLGDTRPDRASGWCIVSAYLLSTTLGDFSFMFAPFCRSSRTDDELPRFIHHLGPKYEGNFQDRTLVRFLTYEASTSLNMHMVGSGSASGETPLKKAIRDGVLINEASVLCKLVTKDLAHFPPLDVHPLLKRHDSSSITISGPLLAIPCRPLELSLWSIGGAQLVLCLVSLAEVSAVVRYLLHVPLNGERRPTSYPGQSPSYAIVFVTVGKIRRIWNESVRTMFHVYVCC